MSSSSKDALYAHLISYAESLREEIKIILEDKKLLDAEKFRILSAKIGLVNGDIERLSESLKAERESEGKINFLSKIKKYFIDSLHHLESILEKKPEVEYVPPRDDSSSEEERKPLEVMLESLGQALGQLVEFLKNLFTEVAKTMTFAFDQLSKGFQSVAEKKEFEEKEEIDSSYSRRAASAV